MSTTHDIFKVLLDQSDPRRVDAYDYELPEELIAAHPVAQRERSRMMVVHRQAASVEERHFEDITDYLRPHDRLVFNNSKVLPGRLHLQKESGGKVEFFVLERADAGRWDEGSVLEDGSILLHGMYRASNRLKQGQTLWPWGSEESAGARDDQHALTVVEVAPGHVTMRVKTTQSAQDFLERHGNLPLPPYIVKRRLQEGERAYTEHDDERYQTLVAKKPGAVAAPTAGLHFSEALFKKLEGHGVSVSQVTLHVGPGTFKPIARESVHLSDHVMHREHYEISEELASQLEETRRLGGRIIAVGTTSARVLETEARKEQPFVPGEYTSEIFLHPGNGFELCDGLITNFHLPNSTLLTLVASFTGYELMRRVYTRAVEERYRFYSYGDGMLLLP